MFASHIMSHHIMNDSKKWRTLSTLILTVCYSSCHENGERTEEEGMLLKPGSEHVRHLLLTTVLCKSLDPPFTSLYFAFNEPEDLVILKWYWPIVFLWRFGERKVMCLLSQLTLTYQLSLQKQLTQGMNSVVSANNRQLSKESNSNRIFRHLVTSSLLQKHTIYSQLFFWTYEIDDDNTVWQA